MYVTSYPEIDRAARRMRSEAVHGFFAAIGRGIARAGRVLVNRMRVADIHATPRPCA